MQQVVRKHPRTRLIMTGRDMPALHQLARQHGLAQHFQHLGLLPYDHLPVALAAMDILLLPFTQRVSNLGRWPNKVGDYLASGRPVVTNPVGEMQDLFASGQGGVLADEQPDDFARAILDLARQPERRAALSQQARQRAEQELTFERMAQRLLAAYSAAV